MITGEIHDTSGEPVPVVAAFVRDNQSFVRIGQYEFPLDTFVTALIFQYVGEPTIVGYLNRANRNKSGKMYELRAPRKSVRRG